MVKIVGIFMIATAIIAGVASRFVFKKSDNVVEEIAEEIIKEKTGYDIDLSPDTQETEIKEDIKKEENEHDKCDK